VVANLGALRRAAGPGVAVLPVVKANAYGHGAVAVARSLIGAGADGLCLANLDEAVALRDAGIRAPLLVLQPIPPGEAATAANLAIAVAGGTPDALGAVLAAWRASSPDGPPLVVEIEVETGLGRGGLAPEDVVAAVRAVETAGGRVGGIWSHLQETEERDITTVQVERFEAAVAALASAGIAAPRRHLSSSAGLLIDGVPTYEAIRPGLAIYGLVPDEFAAAGLGPSDLRPTADELRPVMSLHARPIRVVDLPKGHGVSYGPTWRAPRPSRVATLPLGYGDGWPRALSNHAQALVRGLRVPLVGNVAMDAVMADVTDVPGPPVDMDDEFVLLGRQGNDDISAAEVGRWRTTNSWEVVTAMSARLARVYDAPAGPAG
jgi:alanine racemase